MSNISRELLRKAWPEGYLAARGVTTIGGWHIYKTWDRVMVGEVGCGWTQPDEIDDLCECKSKGAFDRAFDAGDLLPSVDPEDAATWACLLKDLAMACFNDKNPLGSLEPLHGLTWVQTGQKSWELGDGRGVASKHFSIETDDPGEALVFALIELREAS